MDPTGRLGVAYIGGCMRSGSTLLDRMLSQASGMVSAGEVVHLWRRGVKGNELCGCEVPFLECPFWSTVGVEAFGGWDRLDVDEALRLQRSVDRTRYIPFLLTGARPAAYARSLRRYLDLLARLYRGIGAAAGGAVVVDSSKHASTAFLLRRVPGIRLHVVHLVRDSHGVAFSLMKRVRRPEVTSTHEYMPTAGPLRSGVEWSAINGLFHVLRATGTPTTLVTYESLAVEPRRQIGRILDDLRVERTAGRLDFLRDHVLTLGTDHTVAGNPMRFRRGEIELRVDDEWRRSMRLADRAVTSAVTWPLLARYGYLTGSRR